MGVGVLAVGRRPLSEWWAKLVAPPAVEVRGTISTRRLLGALALLTATSTVATVLTPLLRQWPLVLAGLSPRAPFLLMAAGSAPLPVFLLVGGLRLLLADPIHYMLGRRHGSERLGPRTKAIVSKLGVVAVALRPTGPVLLAAGASNMRRRWVVLADLGGTLVYLLAVHAGGHALFG